MTSLREGSYTTPVAAVPVRDVAASQRWYRDRLGWEIGWHNEDGRIGAASHGDAALFFCETDGPIAPVELWIFSPTIEVVADDLRARGTEIAEPLETKPWGLHQMTVRDLNGHHLILHSG